MSRRDDKVKSGRKLGIGLLAVALTLGLGCSTDNIMGPGSAANPPDGGYYDGAGFSIIPDPRGKLDQGVQGVSPKIGASALVKAKVGGVVSLGRFSVEIPAGALDKDTVIEISVSDPWLVMCELSPHGLQFNKPATLTVDYNGTDGELLEVTSLTLGIYWYNEATGRWERVGRSMDKDRNLLGAQLEHFSGYSAGWQP